MRLKCIAIFVFFTRIDDLRFATAHYDVNLQYHNYSDVDLFPTNVPSKVHHLTNQTQSIIQNEVGTNDTFSVPSQAGRRKLKRRKKKRRKKIKGKLVQTGTSLNATSLNITSVEPKRRLKKRRRKKKRKQVHNDILEITTARSKINSTKLHPEMNATLTNLIKKLNNKSAESWPEKLSDSQNQTTLPKSIAIITRKRNRCRVNNGGCSQICRSRGKIKCSCVEGYTLAKNRKRCIDVDECQIRNGGCEHRCLNTLGTYFCDCPSGFRLSDDSKSCQDINECHLRNGHGPCEDTCFNTHGSYVCDCSHLNGTRLRTDKHTCEDVDECQESNPGCSHVCVNTRIGGFCTCPEGMELMSDYKTCQDVDECEDVSIKYQCSRGCVNTIGSYYCEEDFQNDEYANKTKGPACPPLDLPPQGFITCVRDRSLPYDTFTKNGRKIIRNSPGTICRLECPIGFRLLGEGKYVCDIFGKWISTKQGLCIRSPKPKLQCPPHQFFTLRKGHQNTTVNFPAPETNIRWKIVKSYPQWGKNLKGELPEGHHNIQFSVTDPASKLSSTCSFSVVVIKE